MFQITQDTRHKDDFIKGEYNQYRFQCKLYDYCQNYTSRISKLLIINEKGHVVYQYSYKEGTTAKAIDNRDLAAIKAKLENLVGLQYEQRIA